MASKSFYEDFRGTGNLDATKPLVTDGVNTGGSFFWTTTETYDYTDGAVFGFNNYFQRSSSGATVLAPGVGGVRVARLTTHFDILHSAAVSVFEASVKPEFGFRIYFDFVDNYLHLECGAGGSGRWMRDVGGFLSSGTFSTTAPGTWVVLRIEVTNSQTRYYVDDSLVHTIGSGFSYGSNTGPFLLGIPRTLAAHGYTAGSTLAALNYLHVKTETVSGELGGGGGGPDTTAPEMTGALSVAFTSPNFFQVSWSAATDAVGVTGYEYSVDGGAYVSNGLALSKAFGPRATGSFTTFAVRAFDGAGNRSAALGTSIYVGIVAVPLSAPAPIFPLGTEWGLEEFERSGSVELSASYAGAIGTSGNGEAVAILVGTYPGGVQAPHVYAIEVYVRDGEGYVLESTLPSSFVYSENTNLDLLLDWSGRRLVVLHSSDTGVPFYPEEQGRCLTYGLSENGWILIGDQQLSDFTHFSGAVLSRDGLRLAVPVEWPGRNMARGAKVFAWIESGWKENESYTHSGFTADRTAVASDTDTLLMTEVFSYAYQERLMSSGLLKNSLGIDVPNYVATSRIVPFFGGLGYVAYGTTSNGNFGGPQFAYEYRRTPTGWQNVANLQANAALAAAFFRVLHVTDVGTEMHTLTGAGGRTWTWYRREAPITSLPPGFVPPAPVLPNPLLPAGPGNEPAQSRPYALFWTEFQATYEVP